VRARCWFKVVRTVTTPSGCGEHVLLRASADANTVTAPAPSNCVAGLKSTPGQFRNQSLQEGCSTKKMGQLGHAPVIDFVTASNIDCARPMPLVASSAWLVSSRQKTTRTGSHPRRRQILPVFRRFPADFNISDKTPPQAIAQPP
jgi:hypothetical protein